MTKEKKSIYQHAGEWGVPLGLYMAGAAAASIYADVLPFLSILFFFMVLAIPFLVYRYQRYKFIEDDGFTDYAALWMMGILLYIFGTTLASFFAYLILQYARPDFMYVQGQTVIETYSKIPEMRDSEALHVIKRMVDERLMPSPIEMVFNAFWFITSMGSLLSAITAGIARRQIKRRPLPPPPPPEQ